jgi:beta-galactosidase
MVIDGHEQVAQKMELTVFRAPVDNDRDIQHHWVNNSIWMGENLDTATTKVYGCRIEGNTIVADYALAGISRAPVVRYSVRYSLFEDGRIDIDLDANVRKDAYWLPRLGFEMALPGNHDAFSYYGKGPMENYIDLHHCANVGYYESTAGKEYVPYVRPQDHGNHTRVQELTIGDMTFMGRDTFEFCVSRFSTQAIYKAQHTDELVADGKIHLRIDYKDSGVGSAACGPELDEAYQLKEKEITFAFSVQPR